PAPSDPAASAPPGRRRRPPARATAVRGRGAAGTGGCRAPPAPTAPARPLLPHRSAPAAGPQNRRGTATCGPAGRTTAPERPATPGTRPTPRPPATGRGRPRRARAARRRRPGGGRPGGRCRAALSVLSCFSGCSRVGKQPRLPERVKEPRRRSAHSVEVALDELQPPPLQVDDLVGDQDDDEPGQFGH